MCVREDVCDALVLSPAGFDVWQVFPLVISRSVVVSDGLVFFFSAAVGNVRNYFLAAVDGV